MKWFVFNAIYVFIIKLYARKYLCSKFSVFITNLHS